MASVAAAKKSFGKKAKKSPVMKIADSAQSMAKSLRKDLSNRIDGAGSEAKMRAAKLAIIFINLQHSTFDRTFKLLSRVQKSGDKLVKDHVEEAVWLPEEGKEVVKEWSRTLNEGRVEFQKTVDKSYELLRTYFERVQKSGKPAVRKAAAPQKKASSNKKSVMTSKHKMTRAEANAATM